MNDNTAAVICVETIESHVRATGVIANFIVNDARVQVVVNLDESQNPSDFLKELNDLIPLRELDLNPIEITISRGGAIICADDFAKAQELDQLVVLGGSFGRHIMPHHVELRNYCFRREINLGVDHIIDCDDPSSGMIKLHNNKNYRYPAPKRHKGRNKRI